MTDLKIPKSLTKAKISNPHRRLPSQTGSPTVLESSFRRGDYDEIDFWIGSGVVHEAMGGSATSRIDYASSLMDNFSYHLSQISLPMQIKHDRANEILDMLWELGAKNKSDRFNYWMAHTIAYEFSDRFLKMGVSPWTTVDIPPWMKTGKPIKEDMEAQMVITNSVQSALYNLSRLQKYLIKPGFDNFLNESLADQLIERIDGMLEAPGASEENITQALGKVTFGGISVGTSSCGAVWRKWRDVLIGKGATALMLNGDAIDEMIKASPHAPLSSWEMDSAYREETIARRKISREDGGLEAVLSLKPLNREELEKDVLGRRALSWMKTANLWLDAFEPMLSRPLTDDQVLVLKSSVGNLPTVSMWAKLLDAPGGEEISKRLARSLAARNHVYAWSADIERPAYMNPRLEELVSSWKGRSLRKLKAMVEILNDPLVGGEDNVDAAWRGFLAISYLGLKTDKKHNDIEAGMLVSKNSYWTTMFKNASGFMYHSMNVPNTEEMTLLLDLAGVKKMGLGVINYEGSNGKRWLSDFMRRLPDAWSIDKTPKKERDQLLDLLVERGVISWLLGRGKDLSDEASPQDPENTAKASESGETMISLWYYVWDRDPDAVGRLRKAIVKNPGEHGENLVYLEKLSTLYTVKENRADEYDVDETVPDPRLAAALEGNDKFRDFLGNSMEMRLVGIRQDAKSTQVNRNLRRVRQMIALGWKPGNIIQLADNLATQISKLDEPITEVTQGVAVDIFDQLNIPVEDGLGKLARKIMKEQGRKNNSVAWAPIVCAAIERGCSIAIHADEIAQPNELIDYVITALKRRELSDQAAESSKKVVGLRADAPACHRPKI